MPVNQQIREFKEREARKKYNCQCQQKDCKEVIHPKDIYIRLKIVEVTTEGYKNSERSISINCDWWTKFRVFLQ